MTDEEPPKKVTRLDDLDDSGLGNSFVAPTETPTEPQTETPTERTVQNGQKNLEVTITTGGGGEPGGAVVITEPPTLPDKIKLIDLSKMPKFKNSNCPWTDCDAEHKYFDQLVEHTKKCHQVSGHECSICGIYLQSDFELRHHIGRCLNILTYYM